MENQGKLKMLFSYWLLYHKTPTQMRKYCPFTGPYDKTSCHDLCYSFEDLKTDDFRCPCQKFGPEGALQRLEETLRKGGYYLDMQEVKNPQRRIRTIVPCKECHVHPCVC